MTERIRVLLCWLAFVVACSLVIAQARFSADLSAFLPRSPTPAQRLLVEQLRNGIVSRLVLIGIEGDSEGARAEASRRVAAQLRANPSFVAVGNGEAVATEADQTFLWRNRYLLSPAIDAASFQPAALHTAFEESARMLASAAGLLLQLSVPRDPTGEILRLAERLQGDSHAALRDGVWFSGDGSRALLVVQTKAAGDDLDGQAQALQQLQDAFADANANAQLRLRVSGPAIFALESRASIKHDVMRISLLASVLIAALLLLLFRSPVVLLFALLPVATGVLAGIAAVALGFGNVHGITLGFGATLIGEGVDYAVYLLTQSAPGSPPRTTLQRIWPTLRLGVITSICGFSAMLFSGFPGLAQLGLFSIAGLIVAALVTRWLLPVLLGEQFAMRIPSLLARAATYGMRQAPALRYGVLVLALAGLAVIALAARPLWSDELASLSPVPQAEQKLDQQLRHDLGAPDLRYLVIVPGADRQQALAGSEAVTQVLAPLVARGALAGYDAASDVLPSIVTQRQRQQSIPPRATMETNLREALRGLPFRDGLFAPYLDELDAARALAPVDRHDLDGTYLALKFDSLMLQRDGGWAAMLPLREVRDVAAIRAAIDQLPGRAARLIDVKQETDQLYLTYRTTATRLALAGACAVVVLMFIALRSPTRVFHVVAPLAAAVIVTFAVLAATSAPLNIFHLVGLLLVVAVGSNYALFFDRQAALGREDGRTGTSLLVANLATVIGFGSLTLSKVPVLNAIGATVAVGAVLSLAFAAMLAPRLAPAATSNDA